MPNAGSVASLLEPEKRVPVVHDVDVAVAGAGISGMFSALAAAREGAETVLIDRFGAPGGNMGPAMIAGGFLYRETETTLGGALVALPQEFRERIEQLRRAPAPNYPEDSILASCIALKLMDEAGVKLMLSTYAADPILDDHTVCGVFVEGKGGRQAVKAKVVIDGTGDADIAARAGAPIIRGVAPNPDWDPSIMREGSMKGSYLWNSMGLYFLVGGVDWERSTHLPSSLTSETPDGYIRVKELQEHTTHIDDIGNVTFRAALHQKIGEVLGAAVNLSGELDCGNPRHIWKLESRTRMIAFEAVESLRQRVPGFEKAFVLAMSPFLGARGGPCIDGEYTLSVEAFEEGSRFDDVLYVNYHESSPPHMGSEEGCDVPYRCLLPKTIDGLLVVGRGAAYIRRGHDPTGMRARPNMMILGHAGGLAAVLAVKTGVTPKRLDVKELQRRLLGEGFYLGDNDRLRELRLVGDH